MDWNDLRFLLAVAREGTLAGAARALSVEHTTVGRRLGALEKALGARLFDRTPDGFRLTAAGRAVLPHAAAAESAMEAIVRAVAGEDERVEGRVRITTSEGFTGFLVRLLPALRARHPALLVEVLSGNERLDLMRGEADLAIRIAPTDQQDLVVKKLADLGWSLYAASGYAGDDVIGFDAKLGQVPGALWLEEHKKGAHVAIRCDSILSALNAALVGMGIAALPCFLADSEATLRRLTHEVIGTRPVFLVVHRDLARVARVRAVIDFVTEEMSAASARLSGMLDRGP